MNPKLERLAVLIDIENVPKTGWFDNFFKKLKELGFNPYPRKIIFNQLDILKNKDLDEEIKNQHLETICTLSSIGKNRADFRLYLETQTILYSKPDIKAYCIVSSDSDFAELVIELNKENKYLIGLGEKDKVDENYKKLFDKFFFVENFLPKTTSKEKKKNSKIETNNETSTLDVKKEKTSQTKKNTKAKEKKEQLTNQLELSNSINENIQSKAEINLIEKVSNTDEKQVSLTKKVKRTNSDKNSDFFKILKEEIINAINSYTKDNPKEKTIRCSELINILKSNSEYLKSFKKISPKDLNQCGYNIKTLDDKGETSYIEFENPII